MNVGVPVLSGLHFPRDAAPAATLLSPRLWVLPLLALATMTLLALSNANVPLYLAINRASVVLPPTFWACLTSLGDTLPAFALLLPLVLRRPDAAAAALIAVVIASLLSQALKHFFDLPRPAGLLAGDLFQLIGPRLVARSFPSGHTTAAFVVAALYAGHTLERGKLLLAMSAAGMIGLSRIAVGAHWPLDVLGGMTLGWLAGFAGLHVAPHCHRCASCAVHVFTIALFAAGALWLLIGYDSGYADARWLERAVAFASLSLLVIFLFGKLPPSSGSTP